MKSPYSVEPFQPADAPGVSRLFTEVYGDAYPVKMVYDPEQLINAFRSGDNLPVVVRTESGRVIAYTAFYRSAPNRGLYEIGETLVLPEYRKTRVFGMLALRISEYAPALPDVDAAFCENVCNRTSTQRAAAQFGYIETALEIDLMPDEAYDKEQSATGRVTTVDMFRTFRPKLHTVYIPEEYGNYLQYIYGGFDDERTLIASTGELPSDRRTEMSVQVFASARVARVTVREAGADFKESFGREEGAVHCSDVSVMQVWLKSSWPHIGKVVDILRSKGYFFGGSLPRWFDEDGLLMQKVPGQPNWEGIHLYSERGQRILDFVYRDWIDVREP